MQEHVRIAKFALRRRGQDELPAGILVDANAAFRRQDQVRPLIVIEVARSDAFANNEWLEEIGN